MGYLAQAFWGDQERVDTDGSYGNHPIWEAAMRG